MRLWNTRAQLDKAILAMSTASSSLPKHTTWLNQPEHPNACGGVAGTDPQRFEDMALGLVKAAGKIFAHADPCLLALFRSIASARSHSAMPWAARLL